MWMYIRKPALSSSLVYSLSGRVLFSIPVFSLLLSQNYGICMAELVCVLHFFRDTPTLMFSSGPLLREKIAFHSIDKLSRVNGANSNHLLLHALRPLGCLKYYVQAPSWPIRVDIASKKYPVEKSDATDGGEPLPHRGMIKIAQFRPPSEVRPGGKCKCSVADREDWR
ncbi:hypothetical protein EJ06DRAFT_534327 [Trichodelitschia bisporula]|uniref:Uncharacterized protein n=1 Tax=Trichodelitschia bisporula TaxID=703511 RepID=A0A6G1HJF6_9PEZI|nr:hypothetical protein EJ06DRAFT_534327 [Trichodelitschia bisporula]